MTWQCHPYGTVVPQAWQGCASPVANTLDLFILVYEASLFTSMVNLDRIVWLHELGETEEARYRPLPMYAGRCLAGSYD